MPAPSSERPSGREKKKVQEIVKRWPRDEALARHAGTRSLAGRAMTSETDV